MDGVGRADRRRWQRGVGGAAALAAGRAALERRDFKAARRELETIARNDPAGQRAEVFNHELEAAEREARQGGSLRVVS